METASAQLNQLEKAYLVTQKRINDFNLEYLYGFIILSKPQIDYAKKIYTKQLAKVNKVMNDHSKNIHDRVLYKNDVLNKAYRSATKHVQNQLQDQDFLVHWDYYAHRKVISSDIPKLKFELKAYCAESDNVMDAVKVVMTSHYSTDYISKKANVNPFWINLVRSRKATIASLPTIVSYRLQLFFTKSPLSTIYQDRTMDKGKYQLNDKTGHMVFKNFNDKKANAYNKRHYVH